jgi:pimeloyl-ACP methyl ester carboxylesterase
MTTHADDLAALLDTLGVDDVVLCGHSMGGYVAFEFLRRWRERVRGLVLVATRAEADSSEGRKARDAAAAAARDRGIAAVAEAMMPRLFADDSAEAVGPAWQQVETIVRATPVPGAVGALTAMRDRPDSTPLLPLLGGLPTLVVAGEEDRLIPAAAARTMAEMIPGSRLVVLPGVGHLPPLEAPAEFTRLLEEFVTA